MEQTGECSAFHEAKTKSRGPTWRPAPAIRASIAVHLSSLAAAAFDPATWAYAGAAVAGNHVVLGLAGMWPRSTLLGPNIRRLPETSAARREIALTFDDGPDPRVTLRVLDALDEFGAAATFFCVGTKAAEHPDIVREIVHRGHSVENHSQTHPPAFAAYGIRRLRREIEHAQQTLHSICGRAPTFFRAPAGLRSPLLDPVLAQLGLTYVSWTRRAFDTIDASPLSIVNRLTRRLAAGDVLALHDGRAVSERAAGPVVLSVLPRLLERVAEYNLKPVDLVTACRR
jgi:peptidoglycan/xylan/chitin deacetylase (PgdA/CDA1 family)